MRTGGCWEAMESTGMGALIQWKPGGKEIKQWLSKVVKVWSNNQVKLLCPRQIRGDFIILS